MLKIDITNAAVHEDTIKYTDKKTGKPASFLKRFQVGWAYLLAESGQHDPHPSKFEITLDDNQEGFVAGSYQLHPASIYVDRNSRLQMGKPRLVKLAASVKAAA